MQLMRNENTPRGGIAVAGTVLVDTICEIAAYPTCGELTQIRSIEKAVGGCVPNVAVDMRRMDPTLPVYAIGKIGRDADGKLVLDTLTENGVDCTALRETEDERTSFTDVMSIAGGQRTFFTYAGASAEFGVDDMDFDALQADILHLGYFLLLKKVDDGDGLRILKEASARGIKTSIDLVSENSDRYSLVLPCLPYTDYLIVNEIEAGALAGMEPENRNLRAIAEHLRKLGVREKVIIHKRDCAVCLSDDGFTSVGSLNVPAAYIQGSTGAGDAFCAASLIALYEGLSDREVLEFASAAAAVSLGSADATGGLTNKEEIAKISYGWDRLPINW